MAYLAALHAEDFYLACACVARVPGSVSAFQARHGAVVDAALRGRNGGLAAPDELRQVLWEKLFVGRPGSPPKIADYAGRGPLLSWVRAAAVHAYTATGAVLGLLRAPDQRRLRALVGGPQALRRYRQPVP